MEKTAQTFNLIKAGSSPRSVIIATASQECQNEYACDERILADQYANATHSCFGEEKPDTDLYAEFAHNCY
jgi:ribonuclease PH